jgi:DNA-binding transcriptional LysR family regulator
MDASFAGDLVEHLKGFGAFARALRSGGPHAYERAARELRLDASVLRRRIRAVGDFIGEPLFAGRGQKLTLTHAGERLEQASRRILADVSALRADARGGIERVAVGCTGTVATELLPNIVARLARSPQPLDIRVRRLGSAAAQRQLEAGEIDVAVVRAREAPLGERVTRLCEDRLWLLVPSGHALAKQRPLRAADLAREPLITYGEASETRARVAAVVASSAVRAEVDGGATATAYVRAGLGIAFVSLLPGHAPARAGVAARDVTTLFPKLYFYVITAAGRAAASAERVATALREASHGAKLA